MIGDYDEIIEKLHELIERRPQDADVLLLAESVRFIAITLSENEEYALEQKERQEDSEEEDA